MKSETELRKFAESYLQILQNDFSGLNLTRITNFEDFYHKQIIDSLLPAIHSKKFNKLITQRGLVIDVGFGGGFPLLPLAYFYPECQFVGLEARGKKALAVESIAKMLRLKNVTTYHKRIEEIFIDQDAVITFKAVGDISKFLPKVYGQQNIDVYFYKGPQLHQKEDIKLVEKNWIKTEEKMLALEGTEGRVIISFAKKNVPRGTFSNKRLVKLSVLNNDRSVNSNGDVNA